MDASDPDATTAEGYLGGTPSWRTDLYTGRGTLMTLRESVALNEKNGVKHTPELKERRSRPHRQDLRRSGQYAQKLIDELKDAHVDPRRVWLQSFDKADVLYWVQNAPAVRTAGGLPGQHRSHRQPARFPGLTVERAARSCARRASATSRRPCPPSSTSTPAHNVVPSQYALDIKSAGFKHHHLDVRARRPAQGRVEGRLLLLLRSRRAGPSRRTATCTRRSTCWRAR